MSHPFIDTLFPIPWSQMTPDRLKPDILHAIDVANGAITAILSLPPD
jgi:hypothetical protein